MAGSEQERKSKMQSESTARAHNRMKGSRIWR
jgi:hypothetical protein